MLTLLDIASHLTRNGESLAARAGLTNQQWLVLLQIARDPNFPQPGRSVTNDSSGALASEIAAARGTSRATVSTTVTALIQRGLVRQTDDPRDRRRKMLSATDSGLEVLAAIEPIRQRANRRLFEGTSDAELERLSRLLRRTLSRLWHAGSEGQGSVHESVESVGIDR